MRERTTQTTRFVMARMCEECFHDGWRIESHDMIGSDNPRYRCKGCDRIVTNIDPKGGYTDDGE